VKHLRKLAVTVALGALVAGGGLADGPAHAADSPTHVVVRAGTKGHTSRQGATLIEQAPATAGRMRVTITRGSNKASAIVSPGATVEANWAFGRSAVDGTQAGAANVLVTPPSDAGEDPVAHAAAYKASGRSVVTDAMETGLSYEEALKQFGDMDPGLNPTKSQAEKLVKHARGLAISSPAPTRIALAAAASTPYDSWCTDVIANGGDQSEHACIIRYLEYSSGGLRYFSHKQKVTAKDNSFWMVLSSAKQWYVAPVGNVVVSWDPFQTESKGACSTVTLGATVPKTGANVGYSGTVCPDKFGPTLTDSNRGYGSFWGGTSNDYVGAPSLSVVKVNPGYSSNGTLKASMSWRLN
jgi:hypothetical protein